MTDLTSDELSERIVRSLKENSVELAREQRSARNARIRHIIVTCLVFITGIAAGALLVSALWAAR